MRYLLGFTAAAALSAGAAGAVTFDPSNPFELNDDFSDGDISSPFSEGDIVYIDPNITFGEDDVQEVTFEYAGSEAGFNNVSVAFNGLIFDNDISGIGDTSATFTNFGTGTLTFAFCTNSGSGVADDCIQNGGTSGDLTMAFAVDPNDDMVGYFFFGDNTGDQDYDDLVVKATFGSPLTPVPLPAAGWLLLAGVGGIAAMKRRQKKA